MGQEGAKLSPQRAGTGRLGPHFFTQNIQNYFFVVPGFTASSDGIVASRRRSSFRRTTLLRFYLFRGGTGRMTCRHGLVRLEAIDTCSRAQVDAASGGVPSVQPERFAFIPLRRSSISFANSSIKPRSAIGCDDARFIGGRGWVNPWRPLAHGPASLPFRDFFSRAVNF